MLHDLELASWVGFLQKQAAVAEKVGIEKAYAPARALAGDIAVGDDCAAIPEGEGYLLFAAEGILESFVIQDPWFAGYSAVMVNLSDVAAMGGRPMAIVDVLGAPNAGYAEAIWEGMAAASIAYGVPIVGGHTTTTPVGKVILSAAVLGKARKLITSFAAEAGDDLLMVVDLRGAWRGENPFWNASVGAPAERLRSDLELLPTLAERGWRVAGKDISNGGIVGTLAMLLQCSGVGAELWLEALPRPENAEMTRWLCAFPSYGYLLSTSPDKTAETLAHFSAHGLSAGRVGRILEERKLWLARTENSQKTCFLEGI